jgi:hypothetical protein
MADVARNTRIFSEAYHMGMAMNLRTFFGSSFESLGQLAHTVLTDLRPTEHPSAAHGCC